MLRLVKTGASAAARKRRRAPISCPTLVRVRCLSATSTNSITASGGAQRGGTDNFTDSAAVGNLLHDLPSRHQQQQLRLHSSVAQQEVITEPLGSSLSDPEDDTGAPKTNKADLEADGRRKRQRQRLERIRNVGILAHVDAGKTTVTERMLGLAGVVRNVGRVDTGNTVTDYLPAERERGITIQSAAALFDWGWHNHDHYHHDSSGSSSSSNNTTDLDPSLPQDRVHIHLIDTPGHVDFSVEVHRSVAVLDGAVLVVDAVAGVQAQTETVWKCMKESRQQPLPSIVAINKMDKEGCSFSSAMDSIRHKLPGANPLPIQLPIFRVQVPQNNCLNLPHLLAIPHDSNLDYGLGDFVGVLDLIHMRAIVYPDGNGHGTVEECAPDVYPLLLGGATSAERMSVEDSLIDPDCPMTRTALQARHALVEQLAGDCGDELMEEYYLEDAMPSPRDLLRAIRKATLNLSALPVVAAAALRGKGVEPLLDCIADLLPSPLDRPAPELLYLDADHQHNHGSALATRPGHLPATTCATNHGVSLGHPLHDELLAFAFKVCHLQGGRGGSGDGRVVFCRVYSGTLKERDVLHVLSAPTRGEEETLGNAELRKERVGGMLELRGGIFTNKADGICQAGDVCALVGLKNVVTGDTLILAKKPGTGGGKKSKKSSKTSSRVCLAGVASPKPVLQVRLEAETQQEQARLSECLELLAVEDPSLCIKETDAGTLLSGLGELHIEVTLDRLYREFGLSVHKGVPSVAYRETLLHEMETPNGTLLNYDRTVGDTRLQAAVHVKLRPTIDTAGNPDDDVASLPTEPVVTVGPRVLEFLQLTPDASHEECMAKNPVYKALVQGCQGALKRGPVGSYAMANMECHVEEIDADEGLSGLLALPGALRAAAINAVSTTLNDNVEQCRALEPAMDVEISVPNDMVGTVLSDLTNRRGLVEDVITGDENSVTQYRKTLVRAQVPLVEILGYANTLRSLTGGEGNFTAEYKGHAACSSSPARS